MIDSAVLHEANTILHEQLAGDFSVTPEEIGSGDNIFTPKRFLEGKRMYRSDDCLLQVLASTGRSSSPVLTTRFRLGAGSSMRAPTVPGSPSS